MCDTFPYSAHRMQREADMAMTRAAPGTKKARAGAASGPAQAPGSAPLLASVLEEARRAGLLDASELGVLALALLARPDPVAAFFRRTEGRLGLDHDLEC